MSGTQGSTMSSIVSSFTPLAQIRFWRISRWFAFSVVVASLSLFAIPRSGAQDPADSSQQQQPQPSQQQPPQQQPDVQPAPRAQAPDQPDQRRVLSRDTIGQDNQNPQPHQPPQDPQDQDQNAPRQRQPMRNRPPLARPQTVANLPDSFTVPAGKVIFVRLNEPLSSDHNHAGDSFTATLDQPIVINGWVVARRGETIVGSVISAKKAGRVKGVSELGLELTEITVVDGQQIPITTELWNGSAGTSHGADAGAIATTTGAGTIIGAAANGGAGAGVGAGAGALAGIGLVLLTRGKPTVLGPEAALSFRLKTPLTVSTENSKQAFLPVGPDDYNSSPSLRHRGNGYQGYQGGGYPPYYAGCSPYWGCGPYYGYYGPSIGFYGGYWGGYGHGSYRGGRFRR